MKSGEKVIHEQRGRYSKWAFNQPRKFIDYKARIAGLLVELIDARNTSRTCSECGYVDKNNRYAKHSNAWPAATRRTTTLTLQKI